MTRHWQQAAVLGMCLGLAGCVKAQTRIVSMPRVDQELAGNRGFLAGTPPPPADRPTDRQMIMTDVELPTAQELRWRKSSPTSAAPAEPAAETPAPRSSAGPTSSVTPPSLADTFDGLPPVKPAVTAAPPSAPSHYTVQKGDTLEKIAKKTYGDAKRWPKIYEANRAALKNPNRLYPGQELSIPELPGAESVERIQQASDLDTLK